MVCCGTLAVIFFLILPFLYDLSEKCKYHIKFMMYYLILMCNSIFLLPFLLIRRRYDGNSIHVVSSWCRHISWLLGIRWNVQGLENLERRGSFVMVANHQSSLDILGTFEIMHLMKHRTVIVSRMKLMLVSPIGVACRLCGVAMLRDDDTADIDQLTEAIKADGANSTVKVWNFPESKRGRKEQIHDFDRPIFEMAAQTNMPIVPVVFGPYRGVVDRHRKTFSTGHLSIRILPEIPTDTLTGGADIDKLMNHTRQEMLRVYKKLKHKEL